MSPRFQKPRKRGIVIFLVQLMRKLNIEVTGRTYSLWGTRPVEGSKSNGNKKFGDRIKGLLLSI